MGEWEELTICDMQERQELITGKVNQFTVHMLRQRTWNLLSAIFAQTSSATVFIGHPARIIQHSGLNNNNYFFRV